MSAVSERRQAVCGGPLATALVLVLVLVLVLLSGCKKPQDGVAPEPAAGLEVRRALLREAGACVLSSARTFEAKAALLQTATAASLAPLDAGARQEAQDAFSSALTAWQVLEVMRVGPAAPVDALGGEDLREYLYSWPLVSRCAVEEALVARSYDGAGLGSALVNRRGLAALEYLLFYEGADTACAPTSPIVASGSWAALTADERAQRRREYANAAAADLKTTATRLSLAWAPEGGRFAEKLGAAGEEGSLFPTTQRALNEVSNALFYVDREMKDLKLARPMGLRDCVTAPCPELAESAFARRGRADLQANLVGYRRIFEGCGEAFAGTGFDDLLIDRGAQALADKLHQDVLSVEVALAALPTDDLGAAVTNNPAEVRLVYDRLKAVTDSLKTEFITLLDLEAPLSLEGDND